MRIIAIKIRIRRAAKSKPVMGSPHINPGILYVYSKGFSIRNIPFYFRKQIILDHQKY
jgi:hypothetical protein